MAGGLLALVIIGGSAFLIQVFRSPEEAPPSVTTALTPSQVHIPTVTSGETLATVIGGIIGQPTSFGAAALAQTSQAQTVRASAEVAPTQTALTLDAEINSLFAHGRRVFYDEFVDNRNTWFTGGFQASELGLIEEGVFKVLWTGHGTSLNVSSTVTDSR